MHPDKSTELSNPRSAQISISFGEPVPIPLLRDVWVRMETAYPALLGHARRAPASWEVLDWSKEPRESLGARWSDLLAAEAATPLASSTIRFVGIRLPGDAAHVLSTFPPELLDEEAWFFLICEWIEGIEGRAPEVVPEPPETPLATNEAWWLAHLAEASPQPLAHHGGTAEAGVNHLLTLDRSLTQALADSCRKLEIAPRSAILGCWGLLLSKLLLSERTLLLCDSESAGLWKLGMPPAPAPILLPAAEGKTLSAYLKQVSGVERQRAAAGSAPPAILPHPGDPVSDSFASHFRWLPPSLNDRISGAFPRWINLDARLIDQPLHTITLEVREGARFEIRLRTSSLPAAENDRLLSWLEQVLLLVIDHPDVTCREIKLGPAGSPLPSSAATPLSILDQIKLAAAADHPAIEDANGATLTFREVDEYADFLAAHLQTEGLGDGWTVAVCLTPSPWVPVALLGVLRAGDTCVPLDPGASATWLAERLEATDCELVVCDSSTVDLFSSETKRLLVIDREWQAISGAAPPEKPSAPAKVSFILVGTPFAPPPPVTALSSNLLAAAATNFSELQGVASGDRLISTAPAGTPAFAETILCGLAAGVTSVFPEGSTATQLAAGRPTHLRLTVPEFRGLAASLTKNHDHNFDSLRTVVVEVFGPEQDTVQHWQKAASDKHRLVVFASPCGFCSLGLVSKPPATSDFDGSEKFRFRLTPSPACRATVSDIDGNHPPSGYPGILSFTLPDGQETPWHPKVWTDDTGGMVPFPPDARADALSRALLSLPGLLDLAVDPARSNVIWYVAEKPIPPSDLAAAMREARITPTPDTFLPIDAVPLSHGYPDLSALAIPTPSAVPPPTPTPAAPQPSKEPKPSAPTVSATRFLQKLGGEEESPCLIVIPPPGGSLADYAQLVPLLAPDWLVVGAVASNTASDPSTAEKFACQIAEALEPDEPIHLLGVRSAAGEAFEIARNLRASGREVPFLVVAGAAPPPGTKIGGWLRSLKAGLGGLSLGRAPMPGPCGVILTSDLPDSAESGWIQAAPDAICLKLDCSSADLLTRGAEHLAEALWRIAGEPDARG